MTVCHYEIERKPRGLWMAAFVGGKKREGGSRGRGVWREGAWNGSKVLVGAQRIFLSTTKGSRSVAITTCQLATEEFFAVCQNASPLRYKMQEAVTNPARIYLPSATKVGPWWKCAVGMNDADHYFLAFSSDGVLLFFFFFFLQQDS